MYNVLEQEFLKFYLPLNFKMKKFCNKKIQYLTQTNSTKYATHDHYKYTQWSR